MAVEIRPWHWLFAFALAGLFHAIVLIGLLTTGHRGGAPQSDGDRLTVQVAPGATNPLETVEARDRFEAAVEQSAAEATPLIQSEDAGSVSEPEPAAAAAVVETVAQVVSPAAAPADVAQPVELAAPDTVLSSDQIAAATSSADVSDASVRSVSETAAKVQAEVTARVPTVVAVKAVSVQQVAVTGPVPAAASFADVVTVRAEAGGSPVMAIRPSADFLTGRLDPPTPDALPPIEPVRSVSASDIRTVATGIAAPAVPVREISAQQAVATVAVQSPVLATSSVSDAQAAVAVPATVPAASAAEEAIAAVPITVATEHTSPTEPESVGLLAPLESTSAQALPSEAAADQGNVAGASGTPGGATGDRSRYISQVQTWLALHRTYPEAARSEAQAGVAQVYLVVNRAGEVQQRRILQTSGYVMLDREILAGIDRASPVPAIPETMAVDRMQLIFPVRMQP